MTPPKPDSTIGTNLEYSEHSAGTDTGGVFTYTEYEQLQGGYAVFNNPVKDLEPFRPEGFKLRGVLDAGSGLSALFVDGEDPVEYQNIAVTTFKDGNDKEPVEGLNLPKDTAIGNEQVTDFMSDLAVCLNSPWSITDREIIVEANAFDSYSDKDPFGGKFRAVLRVVGYDCITSCLYGYGETEQEALQDCLDWDKKVQKAYNPEDENF